MASLVAAQMYALIDAVQHSANMALLTESFATYVKPFFSLEAPLILPTVSQDVGMKGIEHAITKQTLV